MESEISSLELRDDNPYSVGYVFQFSDGSYQLERDAISPNKSPGDRYYTTKEGDTLNRITNAAYGNSKWWWVIYDSNPTLITDPLKLDSGITLYIPDLNRIKINR